MNLSSMNLPRRIFLDTEFVEDGTTIDLISIALVEGERRMYRVSQEFNLEKARAHPFVSEKVLPLLPKPSWWIPRKAITAEVKQFVGDPKGVEFWADYGSYDWVAFCQLFGTMSDLPDGYPMFVRDFQQRLNGRECPQVKVVRNGSREHDALYDAIKLQAQFHALGVSDVG